MNPSQDPKNLLQFIGAPQANTAPQNTNLPGQVNPVDNRKKIFYNILYRKTSSFKA